MQQLTDLANSIIKFINNTAVPFIFAIAFIFFLFGVFRYFIAGATSEEKRKEGRNLVIYSVVGFAIMIVVWGLVNFVVSTLGIKNNSMPTLPTFNSSSSGSASSGSSNNSATTPTAPTAPYVAPTTQGFVGPQ